jgi:hypothetical protein
MITIVFGFLGLLVALVLARPRGACRRYSAHVLVTATVFLVIALARAASSRGVSQCALDLTTTDKRASAEVRP